MAKKLDLKALPVRIGSRYPKPFDAPCQNRRALSLTEAAGLSLIGVNIVTLPPGAWASQRHWHRKEDEFVYVLEGSLVSITDSGEELLSAGDAIGFPAGVEDGHHLVNRSAADARFLVVSNRDGRDSGEYPDIDLCFGALPGGNRYEGDGWAYYRKSGTLIPREQK